MERAPRNPVVWTLAVFLVASSLGCGDSKGDPDHLGGSDAGAGGDASSSHLDNWPSASATLEAEVFALVNERRAAGAVCGSKTFGPTGPLSVNSVLTSAARAHSYDMVARDFFSHTNPDGDGPGDRIEALGYDWSGYGENIAAGQSTAEAVINTWMNSAGHCSNIMSPDFEEIGIGFHQQHWTQVFGTPSH